MNIDKLFDTKLSPLERTQADALGESWVDMDIFDVSHAFVALIGRYSEAVEKLAEAEAMALSGTVNAVELLELIRHGSKWHRECSGTFKIGKEVTE